MPAKTRYTVVLILNIVLFVLAIPGAVMSFISHETLAGSFVFYTQDSNLFLGIAAAIYVIALIRIKDADIRQVPMWVRILKYLSVCCIAVTFFVVVFILAPMARSIGGLRWLWFTDSMLFQHFLSPIIALAGFLLFEREPVMKFKVTFIALIPTFVYAAFLYPLNIAGIVDGPYPFLQVHNMSVGMAILWFFILVAISYLLAWLIWLCNRKKSR